MKKPHKMHFQKQRNIAHIIIFLCIQIYNKTRVFIHPVSNKKTTSHTFKNQAIMTAQHRAKSSF